MKKFKKLMAAIIAAAMTMAVMAIPAMAESLDEMSYNAVAYGWSEYNETISTGPIAYRCYKKDDARLLIRIYNDNRSSVRGIGTDNWGYGSAASTVGYETVNGYEFIKAVGLNNDGYYVGYYYIAGNGKAYDIYYATQNSDMPYISDFYSVVDSVSFSSPAQTGVTTGPVGNDVISIYVNGSQVFPDADPVIINDRTLVPIRVIAEKLGYGVDWDGATHTVTMTKGNMAVQVQINSTWITKYINGQVSEYGHMDVSSQIMNDRTFIPVRAVTEALGATVDWDGNTRSVFISQ